MFSIAKNLWHGIKNYQNKADSLGEFEQGQGVHISEGAGVRDRHLHHQQRGGLRRLLYPQGAPQAHVSPTSPPLLPGGRNLGYNCNFMIVVGSICIILSFKLTAF